MAAVVVTGPAFPRIPNLRDIGGRRTADGRRVVANRLYRAGSLQDASDDDRSALVALGVRTVIDLRSEWERRRDPDELPGARVVPAPLVDDAVVAAITARFAAGTLPSAELEDWWNLTRVFQAPEEHVVSMRVIFAALLDSAPDHAVLFHCRGGKDRTGLVAALVLEALGVTREETLADFVAGNSALKDERMAEHLAPIIRTAAHPLTEAALFSLAGVKAEWLHTLFTGIEERFGSVERYLADHVGIGEHGLRQLRAMYLETDRG
ncbi:MAG: hypothetical protein A2Z12_04780 [Actinobacteria bacterium RBG_16_68_21]|nr:MAG: hypothetical protein A2Z12_04780 [Actinobacteria bacterium RBG_16_68_21]